MSNQIVARLNRVESIIKYSVFAEKTAEILIVEQLRLSTRTN